MLDFFQSLKSDYNEKIRVLRSDIDNAFSGEHSMFQDSMAEEDDSIRDTSIEMTPETDVFTEDDRKLQLYGNFVQYHQKSLRDKGIDFKRFMKNAFDHFFFVVIKRDSVLNSPLNNVKFELDNDDVSYLKKSLHPAVISTMGYGGQPMVLYYAMQKVMGRISSGEAILFQKELLDSMQTNGEESDDLLDGVHSGKKVMFSYNKAGSNVDFQWGEKDIVHKLETILDSYQYAEGKDDYFIVAIDGMNEEINAIGNFSEFTMIPMIQQYASFLSQINQESMSQIFRNNMINEG